jgi:hypothetical protein
MNTTSTDPTVTVPPVTGPIPGAEYLPGDLVMELDEEGLAALADENWVNEEYSKGTFDEYRGEYIAVVGKKVLGHGKNPHALRELVSSATGIPANRIVTELIFRKQWK